MVKVSIIVPVYNVEKYIEKCLDSLVNQTLNDIEIIIVNDGSTDNSQKIINKYVKKHKNIKSYIKKNGGLSDARNYGLKYAIGEYISFIDSDDYIEKTMMEKMYKKAKENNFDLVVCNLDMVNDKGNYIQNVYSNLKKDVFNKNIKEYMTNMYPSAWNKLYKTNLFKSNVRFKNGVWFEDVEFIYRLIPYVNSIGKIDDILYHYVQRDGAITKTFDKRLYHYIDNWNGIVEFYKENGFYNKYKKEIEFCYVRYLYATFVKQATNYKEKNEYKSAVIAAISNVKTQFPNYRKNIYFYKNIKGIYLVLFNKLIADLLYLLSNRKI